MSDPTQQSLFTTNDAAPARPHPSTEAPPPTSRGHDRGQPHLGTEILQRRQPFGPPPPCPPFELVDGGYHQEQVEEHLRRLITWSRRESTRADSAERTLRAVVQRLHYLEVDPATRGEVDPATRGEFDPATRGEAKPATRGEAKPATRGEAKPAMPGEAKPAMPGEAKPAMPGEAKPATRGEAVPATRGEAKPATRGEAVRPPRTRTAAGLSPPSSDQVRAQLAGSAPDAADPADPADSSVQSTHGARHRPRRAPGGQVDRPPEARPPRSRRRFVPSALVRVTRPRQRRVLIAAVIVLVVGAAGYGWLVKPAPGHVQPAAAGNTTVVPARLTLSVSPVKIGNSYFATAWGFLPGEKVQISWTGPTSGRMDPIPTDRTGTAVRGPIIERDPPGDYLLIVTGLTSGRSATELLQVAPADAASPTTPNSRPPGGDSPPGRTDG